MWMKCVGGCRFFRTVDKRDGTAVCSRVPTPIGVDPLVGCYWGEPQPKKAKSGNDGGDEQDALF